MSRPHGDGVSPKEQRWREEIRHLQQDYVGYVLSQLREIPERLYKYVKAEGLKTRGCAPFDLRGSQPSCLNDMHEGTIHARVLAGQNGQHLSTATLGLLAATLGVECDPESMEELYPVTYLNPFVRRFLDDEVGVVSLSAIPHNPMMWGLYSGLDGAVIGYKRDALAEAGLEFSRILYVSNPPSVHPIDGDSDVYVAIDDPRDPNRRINLVKPDTRWCSFKRDWKELSKLLMVKGTYWAAEEEVRSVVPQSRLAENDPSRQCSQGYPILTVGVPTEAVESITVGPQADSSLRELIFNQLDGHTHWSMYEMEPSFNTYQRRWVNRDA